MNLVFKDPQSYNILQIKQYIKPKILCVDIGTKKHGVAISSQNMIFSYPLTTVLTYKEIYKIFNENNCKTLVIGYPFILEGDNNIALSPELKICKLVDIFVEEFLSYFKNCAVIYFNENFSSNAIEQNIKNKKQLDCAAASYILSNFLESLSS